MKGFATALVLLLVLSLGAAFAQAGPASANGSAKAHLLSTLCEAAAQRGFDCPGSVRLEDLQWPASAEALTNVTPLQLQSVHIDRLLGQIRFRLRRANQPSAPSFEAWCALPDHAWVRAPKLSGSSQGQGAKAGSPAPALVSMRRTAILHLHSENSSAMLRVRPLQSGELGESVRVRVIGNGHTLLARVVAPDYVDTAF